MQAAIYIQVPQIIQVPHLRDSLIPADVGECSYQNRVVILSGARSAESKDLRLSSSLRRIC
jgi:hypothetical protein